MGKMEAREDGYFGQTCNRMGFHGSHAVIWGFCSNGDYPVETAIDVGMLIVVVVPTRSWGGEGGGEKTSNLLTSIMYYRNFRR